MTQPTLYSFRRCPYAMRARLGLEAGNIAVELREIVLRDKAPEFLMISPKGTVPVMVLPDGCVIDESLDVIRWALENSPAGDVLRPEQGDTAQALAMIARMDADFKPHLDHYKYASRDADIDGEAARTKACVFLVELNDRLADQPFLFGAKRSVGDIGIAPFVRQFAHVDRDWFYAQPWTHLSGWLTAFLESAAFKRVMTKYPKWTVGDDVTVFPPENV